MPFEGRYKTQVYFRYFLHLFSVPSFIFSKNRRGLIFAYPKRIVQIIHYLYSKDGFTYGQILFSTKCFLFVYVDKDLLRLKAYKLFENSDADLSTCACVKLTPRHITFIME